MGVDMQTLSADLSALLSGGYVNRFSMNDRSYKVIPQVQRQERLTTEDLRNYYTRTRSGKLIPLSTLVTLETEVVPRSLKGFQQLNAVTLSGIPPPRHRPGRGAGHPGRYRRRGFDPRVQRGLRRAEPAVQE